MINRFHKCAIFCVLLLHIFVLFAQDSDTIELSVIEDNSLRACVAKQIEQHHWVLFSQVDALKCHGLQISSLTGLTHFKNLSSLSLFNNRLKRVDVKAFKKLTYLNVSNNKLRAIELAQLTQLQTLYLFKNKLTTIDLSGLTQLKKIRAMENQITELDLSELVSLEKAYFFNNKLEDLTVRGLENLTFIELRQNPMPDEVYDRYDALENITIVHDGNADDWK